MNRSLTLFDTHVHLDEAQFAADLEAVIARAQAAGVAEMLCVATTADSSRAVVELASRFAGLHAAVGIQPNYTAAAKPGDWQRVVALAEDGAVVALGETGLDRHWDYSPFDVQQDYFDRHLRLAQQLNLPVVIHCRDAEADLLAMLRQATRRGPLRGVMHAFGASADAAGECVELGFYLSFAGNITWRNRKFEPLRAAARQVPAERLLIETDSPYLVPEPLRGRQRRNEPAWLVHSAECLARLREVSIEQLAAQTTANARQLFCRA